MGKVGVPFTNKDPEYQLRGRLNDVGDLESSVRKRSKAGHCRKLRFSGCVERKESRDVRELGFYQRN